MTAALEGGEWSASRPGRTLPPGKDPVPILQDAGWAPSPGLDGRKISSPPGFDPGPSSPQSVAVPTELPGQLNGITIPPIIYKLPYVKLGVRGVRTDRLLVSDLVEAR